MAKRIRIFMPDGLSTISIWDNELDKFLDNGYKLSQEASQVSRPTVCSHNFKK